MKFRCIRGVINTKCSLSVYLFITIPTLSVRKSIENQKYAEHKRQIQTQKIQTNLKTGNNQVTVHDVFSKAKVLSLIKRSSYCLRVINHHVAKDTMLFSRKRVNKAGSLTARHENPG